MKYLYTTSPDEGCSEVKPGVFGRPVHSSQQAKLLAKGWKTKPETLEVSHVRHEKEERQESKEVTKPVRKGKRKLSSNKAD